MDSMDLDAKLLKTLIDIMQRDGLDRLRVRVGETDVDLRMSLPQTAAVFATSHPESSVRGGAGQMTRGAAPAAPENVRKVLAPLVGVFYRSPAPGANAFVQVGDKVTGGQVLCILEAMKLMNEIVSEDDGSVVKICVEDGDLVSLHQELFWIAT
jgi:acetyl-CoA carboxylase biotin carboxyl carrier protein